MDAIDVLVNGNMASWRGRVRGGGGPAMPVFFARRNPDGVARPDDPHRPPQTWMRPIPETTCSPIVPADAYASACVLAGEKITGTALARAGSGVSTIGVLQTSPVKYSDRDTT